MYPARLRYPGAPNPRWWELERHTTNIGAYAPGRSNFATLLLIELLTTHADDWSTFPVTTRRDRRIRATVVPVRVRYTHSTRLAPYLPQLVDGRRRLIQGRLAPALAGKDHEPPMTSLL